MTTMHALSADDFGAYFYAVHGHRPFPWQDALAAQVLRDGRWPTVLDLPTGAGKTAAIDVAVYTLAAAVFHGVALPRRIVMVVDRRVIVDQAAERATHIVGALATPDHPVVAAVRDGLRALTRDTATPEDNDAPAPIRTAVMRGGIPRDHRWALRPDTPTIVTSTVDQVGSGLLFRGYGVGPSMQPVHAGLLGTDTLFLLDEVHLSRPFAETLAAITDFADHGVDGIHPPVVVEMSATPGRLTATTFSLGPADRDPDHAPWLVQRLTARKQGRLVDVKGTAGAAEVLPREVARQLPTLPGATVAVVVNRVATARAVHDRLPADEVDRVLLTGRMRPFDRDDVLTAHRGRIAAGRTRSGDDKRLVVVATQSIEAGADLDFDAMITECAPIDSLRQRFGRLDRLGELAARDQPAQALILAPRSTVRAREPDPVYGHAIVHTHRWLAERHGTDAFDVGPEASDLADAPNDATAPAGQAPLLLPTHLDLLVQTSPRPSVDPPVAPWLHGPDDRTADVSVVWRSDLRSDDLVVDGLAPQQRRRRQDRWEAVIAACPPGAGEALAVPLAAVRAWLRGDDEVAVADVEGALTPEPPATSRRSRAALRWTGHSVELVSAESTRAPGAAGNLRPGDMLIVPSTYGGLRDGTWDPTASAAVADLGDRVQYTQRGRATIRLHPDVIPGAAGPLPDVTDALDRRQRTKAVSDWLTRARDAADTPQWFRDAAAALAHPPLRSHEMRWVGRDTDGTGGILVLNRRLVRDDERAAIDDLDGSDLTNSFTATGRRVTLRAHGNGVGGLAADFARRCGLPPAIVDDLRLAGELHDLGKADPRFQRWMFDGDEVAALTADALVAKSPARDVVDQARNRRAREESGYPSSVRHELLSLALVDTDAVAVRAHDWDLLRHLVVSHHGHGRPWPPVADDPSPVHVEVDHDCLRLHARTDHGLERLDAGVADRFWRLVRRYGWWGLAHLEAILRLADHRRSQQERSAAPREAAHG